MDNNPGGAFSFEKSFLSFYFLNYEKFGSELRGLAIAGILHTKEVVGDIFDEVDIGSVRKVYAAKIKSRVIPTEKS